MKINDEFNSVFIDNDKPEMVPGLVDTTCSCHKPGPPPTPPKKEYFRHDHVVNRPYSDNPAPGPYRPDVMVDSIDTCPAVNPVPNTYRAPISHHHHHCPPPHDRNLHPMEWHEDHQYVTKHELNRVLAHIADADIFRDLSCDGTTVSVGGIKKGTKFRKLTFAQLVALMLYPKDAADDEEYTCETPDGRTILNSTVINPIGDLKEGDSLKGMTVSEILEAMLCGRNNWGTYRWVSNPFRVTVDKTTINAEKQFPYLAADYDDKHTYEFHVVGPADTDSKFWIYDEIIAQKDNCCQKTNVTTDGVPEDLKWSYNPETKKITLHTATKISKPITVVMVRR